MSVGNVSVTRVEVGRLGDSDKFTTRGGKRAGPTSPLVNKN